MLEESLASRNQSATETGLYWCRNSRPSVLSWSVCVDFGILSIKPYFQIAPKFRECPQPSKQAGSSMNTSIVHGNEVLCEYVTPVRPTAGESILVRERKAAYIIHRRLPVSSSSICIYTVTSVLLAPENWPSVPLGVMNALTASEQAGLRLPRAAPPGARRGSAQRRQAAPPGVLSGG